MILHAGPIVAELKMKLYYQPGINVLGIHSKVSWCEGIPKPSDEWTERHFWGREYNILQNQTNK